jgi:hypothetical protein
MRLIWGTSAFSINDLKICMILRSYCIWIDWCLYFKVINFVFILFSFRLCMIFCKTIHSPMGKWMHWMKKARQISDLRESKINKYHSGIFCCSWTFRSNVKITHNSKIPHKVNSIQPYKGFWFESLSNIQKLNYHDSDRYHHTKVGKYCCVNASLSIANAQKNSQPIKVQFWSNIRYLKVNLWTLCFLEVREPVYDEVRKICDQKGSTQSESKTGPHLDRGCRTWGVHCYWNKLKIWNGARQIRQIWC